MVLAPEYVRLVLDENFKDARALWLGPLMAIHQAHLVMLTEQHILDRTAARQLRDALDGLDLASIAEAPYDPADEDLYFRIDRLLGERCGAGVAGRLHTARSRNDIDMTMYRMRLRDALLAITEATVSLRRTLIATAGAHIHTVFAAHTHTQPAQPTSLAHYLLGAIEQLERDGARLLAAYRTTNESPLGACAITGTGFPIDRDRTSRLLGFDRPTGNTYGSIAAVDYLLESAGATSIALAGLGRLIQDLLLWSTAEVGYLRLADGFVQVSSIMPQKRNPVALEHARALASRGMAELGSVIQVIHNTPFGDVVDTEDDLQPLVASGFRLADRAVRLLAAALAGAEFHVEAMRVRAELGWVTATELADSLARDHGVPFMTAHAMTAALVRQPGASAADPADLARRLSAISHALDCPLTIDASAVARALDPAHFIAVRRTPGGPAPDCTVPALHVAGTRADADSRTIEHARELLRRADAARRAAVGAI